jgi:hypothetical protein
MPGRFAPLSSATLSLSLLILATGGSKAAAHHLVVDYRVLPGLQVQIESWFDLSGEPPRGARVDVFRPGQELLTSGHLNDDGVFVFSFARTEPLRVVVSAGAGHRKELTIPESALARSVSMAAPESAASTQSEPPSPAPLPLADRSSRISIKDVLVGVGFVLAVAAFGLSWRNARKLRHLQQSTLNSG